MDPNLNPNPTPLSDSISPHPSTQPPSNLALPTTANSTPGLVFIGFTPRIALHIFTMYSRYKDASCSSSLEATNYDFFSFIHGHSIYINNWTLSGLPDAEKMERLGVRKEVVGAILDERFRGVFGTQMLEYWIEDTIGVNYETLLRLQDQANMIETDLTPGVLYKHCNVLDSPPNVFEGHTTLYKSLPSTESLFLEDGTIDISTLASSRGNDFNSLHSAIYFSPQRSVAEHFREYISIRCPLASTLLLRICIPNDLLTSLRTEELWYGDDWKQFLWHCKTKSPLPEHLQYLERADLVKGHICTKFPSEIARLKIGNVAAEIRESDVFVLLNGEEAVQWCFREEKFRDITRGESGRGTVHVEVFEPLECVERSS